MNSKHFDWFLSLIAAQIEEVAGRWELKKGLKGAALKLAIFGPEFRLFFSPELHVMIKTSQNIF